MPKKEKIFRSEDSKWMELERDEVPLRGPKPMEKTSVETVDLDDLERLQKGKR